MHILLIEFYQSSRMYKNKQDGKNIITSALQSSALKDDKVGEDVIG